MGLLDEFRAENQRPRMRCRVALVAESLENDERDEFMSALDDPLITAAAIERVLKRKGHTMPQETVTRHRRGECSCDK